MQGTFKDLTGKRFGRLLVKEYAGAINKRTMFRAICDCGKEKLVRSEVLLRGETRSCGCLKKELNLKLFTRHGESKKPIHNIWCTMHARCKNPNNGMYHRYGGRGIKVCERWHDFENFKADMGPRPSTKHSIDRIDNNGPYSPENCRWATQKEQGANTSKNRRLTLNGVTKTMGQWTEYLGLSEDTISRRMKKGWPIEDVLSPKRWARRAKKV